MEQPEKVVAENLAKAQSDSTANIVMNTVPTPPKRLLPAQARPASLVLIYPTGPSMGSRYPLGDEPLVVGRDKDCGICIEDASVSRKHAEIRPGMNGHYVIDLKSTNGTFINDKPASLRQLQDGDYLRFAQWMFRYLTGSNVEAEYHEEIYRLTIVDGLTGTHNKRALGEFLERELSRSARHHRPLALLLFDIDHFKSVNDRFGHLAGDTVLRDLSRRIQGAIRKEEMFARYGGEEFALVLPETSLDEGRQLAERLRRLIEEQPFTFSDLTFPVTISMGVVVTEGETGLTPDVLIGRADGKLYQAKHQGRNQVVG